MFKASGKITGTVVTLPGQRERKRERERERERERKRERA
jgi:hypothetical protein